MTSGPVRQREGPEQPQNKKGTRGNTGHQRYYAVRTGRVPGIYTAAGEFRSQLDGIKGCEGKRFKTRREAEAWLRDRKTPVPASSSGDGNGKAKQRSTKQQQKEAGDRERDQIRQNAPTTRAAPTRTPVPVAPPPPPRRNRRAVAAEEIITRELSPQGPVSPHVVTPAWFQEVLAMNGAEGVYRILSDMESEARFRFGVDFWVRLEEKLLDLAFSAMPLREYDLVMDQAKDDLARMVENFNGLSNRRGFSSAFSGATWNFTLKAFGSFASKLHGVGSDVDLQIDGCFLVAGDPKAKKHAMQIDRNDAKKFINVFSARLKNMPDKYKVEKRPNARTPVVKVKDIRRGVSCDIAFPCGDSGSGDFPKAELLLVLNHLDYRLHTLLALVKIWAGHHHLRDAALGRFNTYTLTSLVIFYFQTLELPIFPPLNEIVSKELISAAKRFDDMAPHVADMARRANRWRRTRSDNRMGVMELFLGFLTFLEETVGEAENVSPVRLSTYTGTRTTFHSIDRGGNKKMIHVDDPFDADDNSARALTQGCFAHAGKCATETLRLGAELDADEWIWRVFVDGKKAPRCARSKRYSSNGRQRGATR